MTANNSSNVILCGFMASGKTRVGEMLAKKLGYSLLDLDAIIEREQGMPIKEIFAQKGEAHFRKVEHDALLNISDSINTVIVCGGGTPINFDNSQALKKLGRIFFLDLNFALVIERLRKSKKRPLASLKNADEIGRLKDLFIFRRPIYQSLGDSIDVSHEDKEKTCAEIISRYAAHKNLAEIKAIEANDSRSKYPIYLAQGSLSHVKDVVDSLGLGQHRPLIITSDTLANTLKGAIDQIGNAFTKPVEIVAIKDGEEHKNLSSIGHIHEQMFHRGFTRKSVVLALGGGNVGDVAGFAASIFLRGVPVIQIPTTLLAMVDSSIGGKTGVDNKFGKNLIGAFYNPSAVIIDETLLQTLPTEDYACGMAEIIKHAIISDAQLFDDLERNHLTTIDMIERAILVKANIVFADPLEKNIRAHLNLGHSFAHAIEKCSKYQIKHGQAVAIGLVLALRLSKKLSRLKNDFESRLINLLEQYSLPTHYPQQMGKEEIIVAMQHDKKRDNAGLRVVLPQKIGKVFLQYVDEGDISLCLD